MYIRICNRYRTSCNFYAKGSTNHYTQKRIKKREKNTFLATHTQSNGFNNDKCPIAVSFDKYSFLRKISLYTL